MNPLSAKTKQWLEDIESGKVSMSQRKASVLIKADGSLEPVISEAKRRKVHLVRLTDDKGNDLVAGSLHPFDPLC